MSEANCALCGEAAQGNYSIHRDGFEEGPEVDLCDACGDSEGPTVEQIWEKISHTRNPGLRASSPKDGHTMTAPAKPESKNLDAAAGCLADTIVREVTFKITGPAVKSVLGTRDRLRELAELYDGRDCPGIAEVLRDTSDYLGMLAEGPTLALIGTGGGLHGRVEPKADA